MYENKRALPKQEANPLAAKSTVIEWLNNRTAPRVTPAKCKWCTHRRNDMAEGQTCWKVDKTIALSSGATIEWPGQNVADAWGICKAEFFEPATFGRLSYWFRC